jgi:glyoxylase-like metal-dependent hydrolase (beta-lactamase superfamily II)
MKFADEIENGIFRIEVPLPGSPLKSINSYIVIGKEKNLMIDTGMNMDECIEAIKKGLEEIKVDLSKTDIFITHMHADHSGLAVVLAREDRVVYFNRKEIEMFLSFKGDYWENVIAFMRRHGFPFDEAENAVYRHPGYKYIAKGYVNLHPIMDGDVIDLGNFIFHCIQTPGHTPGHTCLYEPDKKIFFSGDHILYDITPNISAWSDEEDFLGDYLKSLEKVENIDVRLVLPGHRSPFKNYKERIEELKTHHWNRLNEIIEILKDGEKTAYEIASLMKWDIDIKRWEDFPVLQKWFAVGEAVSHLQYLKKKNLISSEMKDGKIIFSLKIQT